MTGGLILDFEDPEGQRLALIDDGGEGDPPVALAPFLEPRRQAILAGLEPIT